MLGKKPNGTSVAERIARFAKDIAKTVNLVLENHIKKE